MFHGLLSIFSFKLFQCHNIHCKLVLDILTPCLNKCLKYNIVPHLSISAPLVRQEKVDSNRPFSGSRTTPQRAVGQVRGTRLLGRLESRRGGESLERVQGPISPLVDSFSDVVTASRSNLSMLHTNSLVPTCGQKRAFCCGCGCWGNIIPMT